MASPSEVAALLDDWSRGNRGALNQLLPPIYAELRRIADRQLRNDEVYLRLVDQRHVDWTNRAQFFAAAAEVMRRILVDHARRHGAGKRWGGSPAVPIEEASEAPTPDGIPILGLDVPFRRLSQLDEELARLVELRAFGGLRIEEAACVLKVSPSPAKREWRTGKTWPGRELGLESKP